LKSHAIVLFITLMFMPSIVLDTGLSAKSGSRKKMGKIYGLEGGKIDLNANLGHRVIVTGYVLPEGKEEAGEDAQKETRTSKGESADFRVRTLKVISKSCTR